MSHLLIPPPPLQGSSIGRAAKSEEVARGASRCVFKDLDIAKSTTRLSLGPERSAAFLSQLSRDAAFLESMQIMDYSLLIGISHLGSEEPETLPSQEGDLLPPRPASVSVPANPLFFAPIQPALDPDTGAALAPSPNDNPDAGGGIPGADTEGKFTGDVYYLGIIDILQQYTLLKHGETAAKSLVFKPAQISAVSPPFYAKRFVDFIASITK
jgi:1-phosphatidylinositol-4-phosphate 5-kinase